MSDGSMIVAVLSMSLDELRRDETVATRLGPDTSIVSPWRSHRLWMILWSQFANGAKLGWSSCSL